MRRMRLPLRDGWIAQLVEQRIENPCVPGSIPGPATTSFYLSISIKFENYGG